MISSDLTFHWFMFTLFFNKYASTKEICYLFSYETTFSIVNYFYTKNIVDNYKRRKMIEVCYLQNIRFP